MTELPDYLPISMLNQLTYCERRFWLMYVCGEMEINAPVLEGIHQHRRAHEGTVERDGERIIHRRVYLWSDRLRISGFADLVEETPGDGEPGSLSVSAGGATESPGLPWFDDDADPVGAGSPRPAPRVLMPVEYKHGRQGRWLNDQLQLCAQAMCLEERTGQPVERGQIFYWRSRRRVDVEFTLELRAQTEAAVARAYALLETGQMPPPIEQRAKCRACSLEGICLPREVMLLSGEGAAGKGFGVQVGGWRRKEGARTAPLQRGKVAMAQLQTWEDDMATLYLTEPQSLVRKEGDTLLVRIPENVERGTAKRKVRVPLLKVSQVVVYGDVTLTSPAMAALLEQGTDVCFCSAYGRFRGRLAPPLSKNSLIRLAQHRAHDDPTRSFTLARAFVRGKLANMRAMLMRANRKRDDAEIDGALASLKGVLDQVDALDPREADAPPNPSRPQADTAYGRLLGLEGSGTAFYFGVFGRLLNDGWDFARRQRRPPRDPVNALLSYGYVLLMNQVASAVSIVGLDPYVGFLHSSQFGKPALALDVMETFRPLVVDSAVLTLLNNSMLSLKDFREELGAWRLKEDGRRTFLQKFEERLDTTIQHPVFDYKATYRRCLELEVRLVSKWLSGEIDSYKPFVVR